MKKCLHTLAYWFHEICPQETEIITQHKFNYMMEELFKDYQRNSRYYLFFLYHRWKNCSGTDILKSNIKSKLLKSCPPMVEQQEKTFEK